MSVVTANTMMKQVAREFHSPQITKLFRRYAKGSANFELGRTRVVFLHRNYVVKFPVAEDGVGDNDWEGSVSNIPGHSTDDIIQYARTRMIYIEPYGFPIVFMERVTPVSYRELCVIYGLEGKEPPPWIDSVDCQQVGYTRSGRLVAYDYGLN